MTSHPGSDALANDQLRFFPGDFTGDGRTELMCYLSPVGDWWLGQLDSANTLQWPQVSTTGIRDQTSSQFLFFTDDFTGSGRTEVLFYYSGDSNWRLGQLNANSLSWSTVGNSAGYGDLTGSQFLFFAGDFTGSGRSGVLFYYSGDSNWRLGQLNAGSLQWSGVGNSTGFSDLTGSQYLFFTGDFTGASHTEVMFYFAGDGNWRLGQLNVNSLSWPVVGDSAGFGNLTGSQYLFFTGDFTGSGHTEVMFYFAGDGNWWLGQLNANTLQWSPAGNSAGFGDLTGSQYLFFTGDFTGSGHTQVMFYFAGDGNWWLGQLNANTLQWSPAGNSAGFGNLTGSQYLFFTGDFTGSGHTEVMFYSAGDGNWWLGRLDGSNNLSWSPAGRLGVLIHGG